MIDISNYTIEPILSVENYALEDTIDIEVDEVHAFYAKNPKSNGFSSISHNSAHIALLDISHPDIKKFITVKRGDTNKKLTQFNISVRISDAFMDRNSEDENTIVIELEGEKHTLFPSEKLELDGKIVTAQEALEHLRKDNHTLNVR